MNPITTSAEVQETQNKTLDIADQARLIELEKIINEHKKTFEQSYLKIGSALKEICDSRLYRKSFTTFEIYVEAVWNISDGTARRMMSAVKGANMFSLAVRGEVSQNAANQVLKYHRLDQPKLVEQTERMNKPGETITPAKVEKAAAVVHAERKNPPSKPKVQVTVEPPKPSPSKAEKQRLADIAALEAQLDALPRGHMLVGGIKSKIANLKAASENVSEAELVAPPEDDARRDEDPLPFHAPSKKQALLDEMALVLQAFLHPNSSHNPGTVRALVSRFIELVNKHF